MRLLAFLGLLLFCGAVSAEQYAVAVDEGDVLELHDQLHGRCPKGTREARYIYSKQKNLPPVDGCWIYVPERDAIGIVFFDGDQLLVPVKFFTWQRGRKPVST